jgi:phosphate transport system ATP-binding protein
VVDAARPAGGAIIAVEGLRVAYGGTPALRDVSFTVNRGEIFGIIGPAKAGKTTLLRCLNRTIDFVPSATVSGRVRIGGKDVFPAADVYALRRKVGMVAPMPVGLPMSIYDNVAFAPRAAGLRDGAPLAELVERCLRQAALWDEVRGRLDALGSKLSGGQQQRLAIARALSHEPDILCLDEFSIAIDPATTMRIERMLQLLRSQMTIVLVTNLTQQARRLADRTMLLVDGQIVEIGDTDAIFSETPASRQTYDFVHGVFG